MSRTGRAEKGGAVLTVEPGRLACVEFEPVSGTYVGYTPLPDATTWKFQVLSGVSIEPDGKVGLLRVTVCPKDRRLVIEHAVRPGEPSAGMATSLQLRGRNGPKALLNGRPSSVGTDDRVALKTP